jgi:hypothetical protein
VASETSATVTRLRGFGGWKGLGGVKKGLLG